MDLHINQYPKDSYIMSLKGANLDNPGLQKRSLKSARGKRSGYTWSLKGANRFRYCHGNRILALFRNRAITCFKSPCLLWSFVI